MQLGKIVDLVNVGKLKMGFKCIAEEDLTKLSKRNIQKYHVNYQPSLKLKRKLKAGNTIYKKGSRSV